MMDTFEARQKNIMRIIQDPESELTFTEDCILGYHWLRYEFLMRKRIRILRKQNRHGLHVNTIIDIWKMRHEMTEKGL